MEIKIENNAERQELLRAIRLVEKYALPETADLSEIKVCLEKMNIKE